MADKEGMERKVWLLPTELSDRIKAYQTDQSITSEVEAARRLLDAALQMRDSVYDLLTRLRARYMDEKDLRILARDLLVNHPLISTMSFEEMSVTFELKNGDRGKLNKSGETYWIAAFDNVNDWRKWPQPSKGGDLDDEIPF